MSLTQPVLNAVPFAVNSAHINEIPIATTVKGAASFQIGFPYETMVDKIAGGKPPSGKDFNGIFNYLSKHQVWLNAGGTYKFNGPLAEALGGYQKGAILASNDGLRLYVSIEDGNITDFNTDMTGWKMIGTSELQTLLDTLQTNINNEETARIATGDYLNGRIDFEIGARIAGDNALADRIWALEHAPVNPSIGVNQSWQDLTTARALDTTYFNTTGAPILISIVTQGRDAEVNISVNGIDVWNNQNTYDNTSIVAGGTTIVPNGSSYSVRGSSIRSNYLLAWRELR